MTENNSEFAQEPGVGNSVNVSSEIKETNGSSEDSRTENCNNRVEFQKELNFAENEKENSLEINNLESEDDFQFLQDHWLKLSTFFRKVYRTILDGEDLPEEYECYMEIVRDKLVANDPHQLFARLEMDLQEFIVEVKLRQMELLNCVHTDEGPHLFIFCLIEGYNKLTFAAEILSPLLQQLEIEHLSHFKITWRSLNQHLFHKLVFTEPKIQKVLPFCISKLGKTNSELSDFNKRLIRQFLNFDDEMTRIGGKWREAESAIIKYHQENSMLDAKERMMKMNWELIKTQTKAFHEELKSSGLCDNFYNDSLKKMKEGLENDSDELSTGHLNTSQCLSDSVALSLESCPESKSPKSCSPSRCETSCKDSDSEILTHSNADGNKINAHLCKVDVQQHQTSNGKKNHQITSINGPVKDGSDFVSNTDQLALPSKQQSQQLPSPMELHKSLMRKQHQKKLMQMMQSSQQKEIPHKIQKQLQEHQFLLQQQRKIDELQARLIQQHPSLMQTHKPMEGKCHQQVQHIQQHQHQEKQTPVSSPKSNHKVAQNPTNAPKCNHPKPAPPSQTGNSKCTPAQNDVNKGKPWFFKNSTTTASSTNKTAQKSSTTQTNAPTTGQNRPHNHPLPDVVKSASYICPRHGDTTDDFCSDDSGEEYYGSERSNSPQRHCDCCYCEVFGVNQQSAPVSRNFQETRERLRLILTKKKKKSNLANNEKPPNEQCATNQLPTPTSQPASQKTKAKKDEAPPPVYKGDKSIEEILDFIEGNKTRNAKRTAKKLRRKQRQEEEERRRKEEEEAERRRLEEIKRKEEEEKRRLEEERRRLEEEKRRQELKEQNRKKNKRKVVKPTIQQQYLYTLNSQNSKKNRKKNQSQLQAADKRNAQNQRNHEQTKNAHQKQVQGKNQNQKKGRQEPITTKQSAPKMQEKSKVQPSSAKNVPKKGQKTKNGKEENSSQPQMVTIKRVMQPNSSEPTVTITLRGATPKEDKVLYTLLNGQMCQVKEDKSKKPPANNNKKPVKPNVTITNNSFGGYTLSNPNPSSNMLPLKSVPFGKSCSIIGSGVSNITERMERLKLGPQPMSGEPGQKLISAPMATQAELTTPTAIQINQAVNQLSSRPTFPNNFDLENIKLPPGITITKVDPATVNRKPIQSQMKQQAPPPSQPQTHIRQAMMPPVTGSSNVIVVDTGDKSNYYQSQSAVNGMKKKRRRRKKDKCEQMINSTPSPFGMPNGLPPRMGSMNPGLYGNPFMNADYRNAPQQPAAIIQMNGSMVTIRNPALHQALTGQQMEYHDGTKMKHPEMRNSNLDENVFSPAPEEVENGDVDEYERELEAFKRFCSQSVPAESKAKVNLNLEDIVLKKKGPVIGCS